MGWKWAGHVSRMKDNKWTSRIMTWSLTYGKGFKGRLSKRWMDVKDDYCGSRALNKQA